MMNPIEAFRFHRLGSGKIVSAGAIVRAIRIVQSQPLTVTYAEGLRGDYVATGADILHAFSGYVQDAINQRGGVIVPDMNTPKRQDRQFRRLCTKARPSTCRWCGVDLGRYVYQEGWRFCEASCSRAFRS